MINASIEIALILLGAVHAIGGTLTLTPNGENIKYRGPMRPSEMLLASIVQHKPAIVAFLKLQAAEIQASQPMAARDPAPQIAPAGEQPAPAPNSADQEPAPTSAPVVPTTPVPVPDSQNPANDAPIAPETQPILPPSAPVAQLQTSAPAAWQTGAVPIAPYQPRAVQTKKPPASPKKPGSSPVNVHAATPAAPDVKPTPTPFLPASRPILVKPGSWSAGIPDPVARAVSAIFTAPHADGIPPRHWPTIVTDTLDFVDRGQAAQAFALGWSAADIFGCDLTAPWHRLDRAGLMLLVNNREINAITQDHAALRHKDGSVTRYRKWQTSPQPPIALLWHLLPAWRANRRRHPSTGPAP